MKTKKCFDICKKSGVFYVYQAEYDEQWLSDGSACYPITGLPMLTEDSICKLYDINDTQRNKCCFEFFVGTPPILVSDSDPNESDAEMWDITIAIGEFKSYHNNLIYKTTDKIVFYACGDKKKISQLLNGYISFVGKKSSQGFGSVTKWTIEEIEEDYSFVKNGIPMRYIPLTLVEKLGIDSSSNQLYSKEVALIPPSYRNNCRDICIYA